MKSQLTPGVGGVAVIGEHFTCTSATRISNLGKKENTVIGDYVTLLDVELRCYEGGQIRIGSYVWMSLRGQVIACTQVQIGNYSIFGRDVYISDTNEHPTDYLVRRKQTMAYLRHGILPDRYEATSAPVSIGSDVWVGERAIILKGVCLGDGCIVAAGSVVTQSFPEYSLVGGNPARLLRVLR